MHKYGIYFYALPNNPFDVLLDTFPCIPDCILVFHSSVLFCFRYLQNYVDDLFAGAWEKRDTTPLPVSQPKATDAQGR